MFNFIIILTFFSALNPAQAEDFNSFELLWNQIYQKSHKIQANHAEEKAADISKKRAALHWLPNLNLSLAATSTNDPSSVLFSNLSARTVQADDFNPSKLNSPNRQWFESGRVSLDWPLFEGGSKFHFSEGKNLESNATSLKAKAEVKEEYAWVARQYAKLTSLRKERKNLQELFQKLNEHFKKYRLDSIENPIGYSGSLGFKMLINRIEGLMDQISIDTDAIEVSLNAKSGSEGRIETPDEFVYFIEKAFTQTKANDESSLEIQSLNLESQAKEEYSKAEKSRFLPRVGLFANENLTVASSDAGTSTEYGVYLKWELFNASNFWVERESHLLAEASKERVLSADEDARLETGVFLKKIPILKKDLERAYDSFRLSSEQIKVTERLFQRGAVNALQFSEVLSRRADSIIATHEIEKAYLEGLANQFLLQGSEI